MDPFTPRPALDRGNQEYLSTHPLHNPTLDATTRAASLFRFRTSLAPVLARITAVSANAPSPPCSLAVLPCRSRRPPPPCTSPNLCAVRTARGAPRTPAPPASARAPAPAGPAATAGAVRSGVPPAPGPAVRPTHAPRRVRTAHAGGPPAAAATLPRTARGAPSASGARVDRPRAHQCGARRDALGTAGARRGPRADEAACTTGFVPRFGRGAGHGHAGAPARVGRTSRRRRRRACCGRWAVHSVAGVPPQARGPGRGPVQCRAETWPIPRCRVAQVQASSSAELDHQPRSIGGDSITLRSALQP